ncbi:protein of unknown function [Thauera humireducens]|jgi:hypothetical protein|nr:protein of unknown function [Thauera humireducens]
MAPTTLPALDDRVEIVSLGAPRPFQNGTDMNPTHFSDVRPCVALLAQYKCLATNVLQGFGREFSGIDLFHARIISKPI